MTQHHSHEIRSETEQSADTQTDHDGELATAPWMGLHYLPVGP